MLNETNRLVDIAVQFIEYIRTDTGEIIPSGRVSKIFGGKYDMYSSKYVAEADRVEKFKVHKLQFEVLKDDNARIELNGGRGSAKSYCGCLWVIKKIAEQSGSRGQIASSTHKISQQNWHKLLCMIPNHWFCAGVDGVRKADQMFNFVNGSSLRFVSCADTRALRSWGGHYCFVDESQDVTDEAINVIWPSLRLSSTPQCLDAGTPKRGEYEQRHKLNLEMQNSGESFSCHRFESYGNIFIPRAVFDLAKKTMSKEMYSREILASWDNLDDGEPIVFRCFNRDIHGLETLKGLQDTTLSYTNKKCKMARQYIIGVDPNYDYPNYAVVYKIYNNKIWVAIDIVSSMGHCGNLGKELIDKGYASAVIITDASGRYNKGLNSSDRLLRAKGFFVTHPHINPRQTESVDAVLLKMDPQEGDVSWYLKLPECEELAEAMESQIWGKSGVKMDKNSGTDHVIDAARYPISFFEPAARLKKIQLRKTR